MPFLQNALYKAANMIIKFSNNDHKGYETFCQLYFKLHMSNVLPDVLESFKEHIPKSAKIQDLIDQRVVIESHIRKIVDFIEICGTFLPN